MRVLLAALLLCLGINGPAVADCPLQSMTPLQISVALRAASDNIANAIAEIEKPSADADKRKVLAARLNRNRVLIDKFLACQEFQ